MILKRLSTFISQNLKNSGIYFLVTTLFFSGCAGEREKTETALRQGNFTVLFPPVALEELPQPPLLRASDVWVTDSQAKRKIQFGTIDSRHETFKALFQSIFPPSILQKQGRE